MALELGIRMKWLGVRVYFTHPRTVLKVVPDDIHVSSNETDRKVYTQANIHNSIFMEVKREKITTCTCIS